MSLAAIDDEFDSIISSIARDIYTKKVTTGTIPRELLEKTAAQLMKGVFSGLGGKSFGYEDPNNSLVAYLRQNVYAFSAAKSLTQMAEFNALLTGPDGKLRSEAEFMQKVAATGALFNKVYLATERNSAIANAQMAQQWDGFKDNETLQVSTVGDDKVRPWHARLDGFTAPKSDPVWKKLWPPFDWNCRCTVIPGIRENVKDFNTQALLKEAHVPKYFRTNSGLTRTIFDKSHTYYENAFKKEKELNAIANYGMQSVKDIYVANDFLPAKTFESPMQANSWWSDRAGNLRASFDAKDVFGTTLRFDNDFRVHTMEHNSDKRYTLIGNVEQIIADPDEVWSIRENGKLIITYIRFYEDYPYVVQTNGTRPFSTYKYEKDGKFNEASAIRDRKGILMYRK